MATGGMPFSKKDSKQRSNWKISTSYSDRDDAHSLNSVPNDVRINNWDFLDWRPNSQSVGVKRRKKSKGNPEREREQSLSLDSPPHREVEKKQRTPSTFPRTKITPTTPTQQRVALENLRQQLTFSDLDDQCSTDGEPNNERAMNARQRHGSNYSRGEASQGHSGKEARTNTNNDRGDMSTHDAGPDSNQIVGRLMQIRDYIKQANSMMDNLKKRGYPKSSKDDSEKLKTLIDNLKEQERGYMGLLQRTLAIRDDALPLPEMVVTRRKVDGGDKADSDDTASVELEVDTDASETTENTQSSSSRPRIEDKLGATSDVEESEDSETSRGESDNMDNTVVPGRSGRMSDWTRGEENGQVSEQEASTARLGELESLRRQEELLKILVDKQDQLRMLQDRQDSLLSMKNKCEKKLAMASAKEKAVSDPQAFMDEMSVAVRSTIGGNPTEDPDSKSNIVGYPDSETEDSDLPKELLELRWHLNLLKNELNNAENVETGAGDAGEPSLVEVGEEILQDKMQDLQDKKQRMDSLLMELQGLRSQRLDLLNETDLTDGALESVPVEESQPQPGQAASVSMSEIDRLAMAAAIPGSMVTEAQEKLEKLKEVRERLNQLRDLVSYYQTVKGEGDAAIATATASAATAASQERPEQSFPSVGGELDPQALLQQLLQQLSGDRNPPVSVGQLPESVREFARGPPQVNLPPGSPPEDEHSDEENASDSNSNKDSQLSSLGPWGDDPEIQEKVQKLRAAKQKLRQLQDIVAMVQQSPNGANFPDLSETMMELAASEEGEVMTQMQNTDQNISVSEGELPPQKHPRVDPQQRAAIQHQHEELESLRSERERLMAVQSELQCLQEQFQMADDEEPMAKLPEKDGRGQTNGAPMVTFASNDELYSKMRKQRILREELRQKKKELEAIMRKDRNKKQYFRNQDNHSDTVSYSTDAFAASASADATMATWGGSTVDNLGSITEDEDGNVADDNQDDGYPSDGIVQVEEEEEENDSDGTYTIEEDARQRRSERSRRSQNEGVRPKLTKAAMASKNGGGGGQGCPRPMRKDDSVQAKQSARVVRKKSKQGKRDSRLKQENYRSAEEIVQEEEQGGRSLGELQQQLDRTSQMCQALLLDQQTTSPTQALLSPSGYGLGMRGGAGAMMPDVLQQQLQQQQLMMCLNQCYQQLSVQQVEMQNIQQQLHSLTIQVAETSHQATPNDNRDEQSPVPTSSRLTTPMTTSFSTIPNSTASFNMHASRQASFTLNPYFPPSFSYLNSAAAARHSSPYSDAPQEEGKPRASSASAHLEARNLARQGQSGEAQINNLRPVPPPRIDSYLQSGERSFQQSNNRAGAGQAVKNTDSTRAPRLNLQDVLNSRKSKHPRSGPSHSSAVAEGLQRYSPTAPGAMGDPGDRYRPGLSAGISGAGFHDGTSLSSIMSARTSEAGQLRNNREGDTACDLSLFEALRETIYSEVATLISQNESRPHFLIELFRVLQILGSDYLRQRGLYAIKDLVSKTLTDDNDSYAAPPPWMEANAGNYTPSEQTPSESLATSDDEEVKARLRERVAMVQRSKHSRLLERSGSLKNDAFDYVEKAENTSSLSTPSNSLWESPFAQDSLGDTVIHFDKALEKMREYERMKAESVRVVGGVQSDGELREGGRPANLTDHLQSAAVVDQGSESSVSDMPYPRIDTNQLDQQIKSIMTEIIPVIKEHMDDACSPQLLAYIKRLVLSLTRQHDNGQEFARFFHRQLGSILQDSMTKFEGRKMRECGEEILVDMSEVLFNELAFFRLMQDLDDPTADKLRNNTWFQSVSEKTSPNSKNVAALVGEESNSSGSSSLMSDDDRIPSTLRMTAAEEEDLGKDRDDELASEMPIHDVEEKDDDPESPYKTGVSGGLQIELAVSETKPFTRIGSDEDEDEADESQSMEDPSETAVSRDNKMEHSYAQPMQESTSDTNAQLTPPGQMQAPETSEADGTVTGETLEKTADAVGEIKQMREMNGDVQINGDNICDEITVDDLPNSLSICGPGNLEEKLEEELRHTTGTAGILVTMETPLELAGDGNSLKEPESSV